MSRIAKESSRRLKACVGLVTFTLSLTLHADPVADRLAACMAESTTGKDRQEYVTMFFVALAHHPTLAEITNKEKLANSHAAENVGALITRLMSEDCVEQARAVSDAKDSDAVKAAFGALGAISIEEMMRNPEVAASFSEFKKYINAEKLNTATSSKK